MPSETYRLTNGLGILSLSGSETECLLMLNGKPIHFCWFAEIGTVWRYHIGKSINENILSENFAYQRLTELGELYANNPLSLQFRHLLEVLENAEYELMLTQFTYDCDLSPLSDTIEPYHFDTYGGLFDITFTQAAFNEERIEYYRQIIRSGKKPIAVLLSLKESYHTFVIDGHHKLIAYGREKITPVALRIMKVNQQEMDAQEGIQLIQGMIGKQNDYENAFLQEKRRGAYKSNYYSCYRAELATHFKEY